ncbi:hypothetical protein NESM_000246900 [Novymonas esmeraldas]|uniref:Uncharacterized protein n=1 Tax=Novymonas esmeraldas TaxID=1808958 RepID=A0AAW0F6Z2_9TRYP
MSISASTWAVEQTGTCAVLELRHRAVVMSIEAELLRRTSAASTVDEAATLVLWALTTPRRVACFADGLYAAALPIPLAFTRHSHHVVVPLPRWDICGGTRTALLLAPADAAVADVREALEAALNARRMLTESSPSPSPLLDMPLRRWRCVGTEMVTTTVPAAVAEWQPLLHRRWYELKSYVRQGTMVSPFSARAGQRDASDDDDDDAAPPSPAPLFAGDVKEADAVSVNRARVLWCDGGVGLLDEVKPYHRVYEPARAERTVRVRRFPHRYADVVGEVPVGQRVEALGRATDPFTGEHYVLVYLPTAPAFAAHIPTYELTYVEEGRYIWGWSKLAGTSGLPLLVEAAESDTGAGDRAAARSGCEDAVAPPAHRTRASARERGGGHEVMTLPEPTFYTPVRDGRAVRIRAQPSLTGAVLREMEMNEVRAAVALVTAPVRVPGAAAGTTVPHVFVEWQHGGYSLLHNATEAFLAPVELSRVPRRFPIRTRSRVDDDGGADAGAPEIVDLSSQRGRKRARHSAAEDDEAEEEEARIAEYTRPPGALGRVEADPSLLSPHSLPASLQASLKKGVVRLEDLPALGDGSEGSDADSPSDGSDDDHY